MVTSAQGLLERSETQTFSEEGGRIADLAREVRDGVKDHVRLFFDEMKLLSAEEAQAQASYAEKVIAEGDVSKLQQLHEEYASQYAQAQRHEKRDAYYTNFRDPLEDMHRRKVISEESYRQWLAWMEDRGRAALEKTSSIQQSFQEYRKEHEELAANREKLLHDSHLKHVSDSDLQKDIKDLTEDHRWFKTLEFTQRKNLIDRIKAGLAAKEDGPAMEQLKNDAEKILTEATKEPHPALHRDKVGTWLKRIFEDGVRKLKGEGLSVEQIIKKIKYDFLEGTGKDSLPTLIARWRTEADHYRTLRLDPAFAGIKGTVPNLKGFLWLHFSERQRLVGMLRACRERAKQLRSRAGSLITGASAVLDARGRARWLNDYIFNGRHTLEELESIINGNLAIRLDAKLHVYHRYEKAKTRAKRFTGIRGMQVPEKGGFLNLKYKQQMVKVEEMERRIGELEKGRPDFLLIRHVMDRSDWEEALTLIAAGKKKELSPDDARELASMERYVASHQKEQGEHVEKIEKTGKEAKEIDTLIAGLPSGLQDIVIRLSEQGPECVKMFGWGLYNREWCNQRGYLDPPREVAAIQHGKEQALQKMRRQKRKGKVDETIQGETGEEEYIELSRTAATNVCLDVTDSGAKNAMIHTVSNRRNDHRAWYWTNIILHRGGALINLETQKEENRKIYKIGKLLVALKARGEPYSFRHTEAAFTEKAKMAGGGKKGQEKD